ncbi:MAG: glycosyltransferase [Lachnospiraceae bacterium]|nr:glycosyltransferase [Lachnospiraceae bacterium]
MSKLPISVCIIAKNEEKFIEDCLRNLKPYGMEIVVADTGSTDRTKEIAEKYADKVVDFEWINDFSAARNYCASVAKNNWILAIDCDEIVNAVDVRIMRILMQKYPKHTGVLRLKNITRGGRDDIGYVNSDIPRFYNKNYYLFQYSIHEQICRKDVSKRDIPIDSFLLPIDVIHHGYALDNETMKVKQERNLELLYQELERTPDKGYVYFQIGQSLLTTEGYEKAIEAYEKGVENIVDMEGVYVSELIIALAYAYADTGRVQDALALMEKYAPQFQTAKYIYAYANILWVSDQMLKALGNYIKVTMMKDMETLGSELTTCYGRIIQTYEAFGEKEMAENFHQKFLQYNARKERVVEKAKELEEQD